jgi:hypothetical protein
MVPAKDTSTNIMSQYFCLAHNDSLIQLFSIEALCKYQKSIEKKQLALEMKVNTSTIYHQAALL